MSLTLSIEDLARFELLVGLSQDGTCTFNMKSHSDQQVSLPPPLEGSGISINFHTVRSDKGTLLSVSTAFSKPMQNGPSDRSIAESGQSEVSAHLGSYASLAHPCEVNGVSNVMSAEHWAGWPKVAAVNDFAAACVATATNSPSFDDSYFDIGTLGDVPFAPDFTGFPAKMPDNEAMNSVLASPISCLSSSSSYASSLADISDQVLSPASTVSSRFSPPRADDIASFNCPPPSPEGPSGETTQMGKTQRIRRHPCLHPGCTRKFTSEYTRRVHMEAHKPKVRKCVPCTIDGCKEVFSRRHDRLRHEVSQHGKVCEWLCKECSRFFSSQRRLENHKCRGSIHAVSRWPIMPPTQVQGG
ncbi:hypothetical protein OE88DRAFT_1739098 [Heliocybe sulcata]|uniref:C2H2-type domain-containing protein n=1 Tax=Heliocybe sulcata TaxID=5364 RepID=A0A5C3MN99_9AGAM|nr:hypothetical protein OE88DRAFT_1739098 [Heliocybe sulcata]